jgi:uncharacterized protein YecE (DUF72 family)
MLAFYAERLPTVEINNTFYRMPRERVVIGWADQVPETFRFVLKASRRITHMGRLRNVESELRYFLQASTALGPTRGPSLFQLPPNMKKDLAVLEDFLALLPTGWPAAFEFRHASWFADDVYGALRGRNAALVLAETDDGDPEMIATADWGYLRLRRTEYTSTELAGWAERVRAQAWNDAYVFLKHEDKGLGPKYADELRQAL